MNNLPKSVDINGHKYHLAKLNPMTQFHVTRRLAPALATLGLGMTQIKALGQAADQEDFMRLLGPLSGVVAAMTDEDSSYVIRTCLEVVTREDSGQRAVVMVDGRLMYEDIDMVVMLRLVFDMLRYNLAGFTQGLSAPTSTLGPSDTKAS